MDRRAFARLALLMLVGGCSEGERKYAPLTRGAALPAEWLPGASADGPGVVWIFRTDDCLTCESLDYSLRRLQRAHPEVPLSTIHVGRLVDVGIPRAFLADRRISAAAYVDIPPKQFRRIYGDITLPALIIRNGDRITWSSIGSRSGLSRATIDSLFTGQITAANLPVAAASGGSSARHRQE